MQYKKHFPIYLSINTGSGEDIHLVATFYMERPAKDFVRQLNKQTEDDPFVYYFYEEEDVAPFTIDDLRRFYSEVYANEEE